MSSTLTLSLRLRLRPSNFFFSRLSPIRHSISPDTVYHCSRSSRNPTTASFTGNLGSWFLVLSSARVRHRHFLNSSLFFPAVILSHYRVSSTGASVNALRPIPVRLHLDLTFSLTSLHRIIANLFCFSLRRHHHRRKFSPSPLPWYCPKTISPWRLLEKL